MRNDGLSYGFYSAIFDQQPLQVQPLQMSLFACVATLRPSGEGKSFPPAQETITCYDQIQDIPRPVATFPIFSYKVLALDKSGVGLVEVRASFLR